MVKKRSIVAVFGTFDGLHDGHRFALGEARKLGEYLIAIISPDEVVSELKKHSPQFKAADRIAALEKENLADEVLEGDRTIRSWNIVRQIRPNVIALGYDQDKLKAALESEIAKFAWDVKIAVLPPFRPKELHSSLIKKNM